MPKVPLSHNTRDLERTLAELQQYYRTTGRAERNEYWGSREAQAICILRDTVSPDAPSEETCKRRDRWLSNVHVQPQSLRYALRTGTHAALVSRN